MIAKPKIQPDGYRAVSPVIGVILMVAITVILAAVIGAFVLEIGDQQETAPNASFTFNENVRTFSDGSNKANITVVRSKHGGGDTIDITQFDANVNGNDSVWGSSDNPQISEPNDPAFPQPNILEALGSNDRHEFTSGENLNLMSYKGWGDDTVEKGEYIYDYWPLDSCGSPTQGTYNIRIDDPDGNTINTPVFRQGDSVSIIWTAESGGKTQTLAEYKVQNSVADC
jgi:flagellin-like protein